MIEGLFQPTHLIIIMAIVLIVFGPGKLAGVGGALGTSVREFKQGVHEGEEGASTPDAPASVAASASRPAAEPARTPTLAASRADEI